MGSSRPFLTCRSLHAAICLLVVGFLVGDAAMRADVVVVANRSREDVRLLVRGAGTVAESHRIEPRDLVALPASGPLTVEFTSGRDRAPQRQVLELNRCYYLGEVASGAIRLARIDLGEADDAGAGRSWSQHAAGSAAGWIAVKILVDDDEPAVRSQWEKRLRDRIASASRILEPHSGLGLRVVAVGTWTTDDRITDFGQSLREFERRVDAEPARVAIGFSSQYEIPDGRTHLGGTRGPLARHVLLREWSQHVPEPQRVELLLHELGHHLGAAHSPEPHSVMRPVLLSRRFEGQQFPLRFDPLNTLAMYLVGEEIKYRSVSDFSQMTPETDQLLRTIYTAVEQAMPGDPAAGRYAARLGHAEKKLRPQSSRPVGPNPLMVSTRRVVDAVIREAVALRDAAARPAAEPVDQPATASGAETANHPGDRLAESLVRAAAREAMALPESQSAQAFVLGIGMALDDSPVLRRHPGTRDFVTRVEPDDRRSERLELVGRPTAHGRRDLLQHFVVSSYLASVIGARATRTTGLAKEFLDANRDSGFSLADLAANEAGIRLALGLSGRSIGLNDIAESFLIADYVPSPEGLAEGLSSEELSARAAGGHGSMDQLLKRAQDRVGQMEVYRNVPAP